MNLRPLEESDKEALLDLQPPGWRDIVPVFEWYVRAPFCVPIGAFDGKTLTGAGSAILFKSTAWLGHIIVHPEWRRQGVATTVITRLLEQIEIAGIPGVCLVATDDGKALYERFGFTEICAYDVFERDAPRAQHGRPEFSSNRTGPATDVFPGVAAAAAPDYEEILRLDQRISGEDRLELLRLHLATSRIVRSEGSVCAAFFPELGEGLLEAESEEAAAGLLPLRLRGSSRCVLPEPNRAGRALLEHQGFLRTRRGTRMHRGAGPTFRPECLYSRIGGNLG